MELKATPRMLQARYNFKLDAAGELTLAVTPA